MPDPVKSGSKVKSLEKKIQTLRGKKANLKETIRGMVKKGHRGDVGLVKEMEGIDSQIEKLRSQLKEIKGAGGGGVKANTYNPGNRVAASIQKTFNDNARKGKSNKWKE